MSAQAGWYPDPGGGQGLFRYWDGKAWSAATSPYPTAAPPSQGITGGGTQPSRPSQPSSGGPLGSQPGGPRPGGGPSFGTPSNSAYANYQQVQKKRSPVGWWIGGAALLVVIIIVAVVAIRAATGGGGGITAGPGGQASQDVCPVQKSETPQPQPGDGRVHGGPLSYPTLGSPWSAPKSEVDRLAFGTDVWRQDVLDQENYDGQGHEWVASILVAELQAGDGFFTPEQGSQIVVKCIVGTFYGEDTQVTSKVKRNEAATIDGHEAWVVESQLSFDIPGLVAKGEMLLVAIVSTGDRAGLYYASIPDTQPELVQPARETLKELTVDT